MGGSSGGTSTTVQTSEPWKQQIPYLTQGFQNAQDWYNSSNPQYYDFPTTVPYSSQTQQALQMQQQQATQGSPFVGTGSDYLNNLLGGSYLGSNPAMGTYGALASGAAAGSNPAYDYLNSLLGGGLNSNPAYGALTDAANGGMQGNSAYPFLNQIAGGVSNPAMAGLQGFQGDTTGINQLLGIAGGQGGPNPATSLLTGMATNTGTNPNLDAMFKQGADALGDNFRNTVNPTMQAYWEGMGGSPNNPSAQQYGQQQLQNDYLKPMTDLATNLYGGQYQADQQNRLQAAGALGNLSQGDLAQRIQAAQGAGNLAQSASGQNLSALSQLGGLAQGGVGQQLSAASQLGGLEQGGVSQQLSAAGNLGSLYQGGQGQQLAGIGQLGQLSQQDLANILSGASGLGGLYGNAQQNQLAGLNAVPSMQQAPYTDINALGQVGAANESKSLEDLQAQMAQFQFNQNEPLDKLQQYMQLIGGANYGGTSTTTGPNPNASNPFGDIGSAAMMGATMLPKMFGV